MFSKYDNWLMTDKSSEQGDQIIARDFRGYPVTENDLQDYILVDGELVQCACESYKGYIDWTCTVEQPTLQDIDEITAIDFRGYPVTENDLQDYVLVEDELVQCVCESYREYIDLTCTVIDQPTLQDVKEAQ